MPSPISTQFGTNPLLQQNFDPNFQLNALQSSVNAPQPISNVPQQLGTSRGVSGNPNILAKAPISQPPNLNTELANIQAIRAGTQAGGGIGQTVGGLLGAGAGTFFGGPAGGALGSSLGAGLGSIVDFGLNKSANDRARKKELEARRRLLAKEKRLSNSRKALDRNLAIQGLASEREQQALSKEDLLRQQREAMLGNLSSDINQKDEFQQLLQNRFLATRRF
jgi:hypothetical protein